MARRYRCALGAGDYGQALAEAPITVLIVVVASLCLLQVAAHLHCRAVVGHAATAIARVASTSSAASGSSQVLTAYARSQLAMLPDGDAFYIPSSLNVAVEGDARSARVVATVSVSQRPLPLVGLAIAGPGGLIEVSASASAQGAERWAVQGEMFEELVVGAGAQ